MSWLEKIKEGLRKTKESIGKKLFEIFKARELDDEFYEELEYALISSDFGVKSAENIIEELKDQVYRRKITAPNKARNC